MLMLLAAGVVLITLAVRHNVAPAAPASCSSAKAAREKFQWPTREAVQGHPGRQPKSTCAREGMKRLAARLCFRADLMRERAGEEAKKLYVAVLAKEPPDEGARECALNGIAALAKAGGDKKDDGEKCPQCMCTIRCTSSPPPNEPSSSPPNAPSSPPPNEPSSPPPTSPPRRRRTGLLGAADGPSSSPPSSSPPSGGPPSASPPSTTPPGSPDCPERTDELPCTP